MIYQEEQQYLDLAIDILTNGILSDNRTEERAFSVFGRMMKFNLSENKIPLLTTKKVFHKGIIHELLWMLSGSTNIRYLKQNNVNIWDKWVKPGTETIIDGKLVDGELPKIYQHQWRSWNDIRIIDQNDLEKYQQKGYYVVSKAYRDNSTVFEYVVERKIDQIKNIINTLKTNPESRRIILSAWNVAEIDEMALPPCHMFCQFYTQPVEYNEKGETIKRGLSCLLYMRSNDLPLGNPFNIVQYSLLTKMIAQCVDMVPMEFVYVGGNVHIYENQMAILQQLPREPKEFPKLIINPNIKDIFSFKFEDFEIVGYDPHPEIKFPPPAG